MKRAALATLLVAASVLPAAAQVGSTWGTTDTDTGSVLFFGTSETDNSAISFTCDRGNANVLISTHLGSKGLKADEATKVILTAGKVKKEFSGKGVANDEASSVDVDAGGKLADIKAALAGGKALVIETKGVKQQIALDGAPQAFAQFESACK